ncbi:hypothetical protein BEH_26390 (plasmid) [Priestia filamentosa]|uniref:DUF4825 domain-containing protein n=1 Tax=Priestia filamentosa TaxID=1402861 RepID=A0A2S1LZS2_9BACI|nr:DUF4825 domain-containing protein [Priestia filamentosa]AWG44317.1 hypothetical protein BEH_26390 [Priestia filamentosa]
MRKTINTIVITASLAILFLAGCNSKMSPITLKDVQAENYEKYENSYVGNNSAISGIVNNSPGNLTFKSMSLKEDSATIEYGMPQNLDSEEEAEAHNFWFENKNYNKYLTFNAGILFFLVQNLDYIKLEVNFDGDNVNYNISRKDFYNKYPSLLDKQNRDLKTYIDELKDLSE